MGNFGSPSLAAAGRAPALAETWNGKRWHVDSAADPGAQTLPDSVACPASGTCLAVGWYRDGAGTSAPLVENKSGSRWLNQAAPKPYAAALSGLGGWKVETLPVREFMQSASCPQKTYCVAVGADRQSGEPLSSIRS